MIIPSFFIGYVLYGPLDEYFKMFDILGTPSQQPIAVQVSKTYAYHEVSQSSNHMV